MRETTDFFDYNVMLYNGGPKDRPVAARRYLKRFLRDNNIDAGLIQECRRGTARALRTLRGYRLYRWTAEPGQADVAILVRKDIKVTRAWCQRITHRGWYGHKANRLHAPRWMPTVLLNGHLRLGDLHMPPGVSSAKGRLRGKGDRVEAFEEACRYLNKVGLTFNARPAAWVIGGDMNWKPTDETAPSPVSVAKGLGARVAHAGTIDFALYHGCEVSRVRAREDNGPSDHKVVTFTVRVPKN